MIQKIEVLAADVDMTLSSKASPLPEITIQALKELHDKNVKIGLATGREITEMEKTKGIFCSIQLAKANYTWDITWKWIFN